MPLVANGVTAEDLYANANYIWEAWYNGNLVFEPVTSPFLGFSSPIGSTMSVYMNKVSGSPNRRLELISMNGPVVIDMVRHPMTGGLAHLEIGASQNVQVRSHLPVRLLVRDIRIEGTDYGINSVSTAYFPNLTRLHIKDQNSLTTIPLSGLSNLTVLEAYNNSLTTINLASCPVLDNLWLTNNNLTTINLASNPVLRYLQIDNNNISSLDLSNNPDLLWCLVGDNNLTTIDLSNNPDIAWLRLSNNNLTNLDISFCPNLTQLEAKGNAITSLDFSNTPLITTLDIGGNSLSALNTSMLTSLQTLFVSDNNLTAVDFTNNTGLQAIQISDNNLSALNVSMLANLQSLDCTKNSSLATLSIAGNNNLTDLRCGECAFTSDAADPSIIDAIIIKMDQNITSGGVLHYDTVVPGGIQPTNASRAAYDSLVLKGCQLQGKVPLP